MSAPRAQSRRWTCALRCAVFCGVVSLLGVAAPWEGKLSAQAPAAKPIPALPKDFEPPSPRHPSFLIEQELIDRDEIAAFAREQTAYKNDLRTANTSTESLERVRRGLRIRMHRMTLVESRHELHRQTAELKREITDAGSLNNNPATTLQFRDVLCDEVIKLATELLQNNFYVRIEAAYILATLNSVEADSKTATTEQVCIKIADPLYQTLIDPQQAVAVKIWAANGLKRVLASPQLNAVQQRMNLATGLLGELANATKSDYWYSLCLIDALTVSDVLLDADRKPFVVQGLLQTMVDQKRIWQVRCAAARALGRVQYDPQINMSLVAYETVRLQRQMLDAYNQDPSKPYWKGCLFNVYLAFNPLNETERKRQDGLLLRSQRTAHQAQVAEAYALVLPVTKFVLIENFKQPKPVPAALIDPMTTWLDKNKPDNYRAHPSLDPITTQKDSGPNPPS